MDPNWEDTLRVTTTPTQSGTYGNNGNALFSVRQSRLGIKGEHGPDITYKLEGELFGMGSNQGQTTLRVRPAWATYKESGMGQTWSNFMDPADHVMLGTEFGWGQREDIDGNVGSDYRIQFSLKVDFDTGNLMSTR